MNVLSLSSATRPHEPVHAKIEFHVLFVFACADLAALNVGGGNLRAFYAVALIALVFHRWQKSFDVNLLLRMIIACLSMVPSVIISPDTNRSIAYVCWLAVTFLMTFCLFPTVVRRLSLGPETRDNPLYRCILMAYRGQIIVAMLLIGTGLQDRPHLLYYETSYFSISMSIYVPIVIHRWMNERKGLLDLLLISIYLIASVSGAFIVVLALSALLSVNRKSAKYMLIGAGIAISMFAVYVVAVDDLNTLLVRAILSGEADAYEILLRGGNRLSRLLITNDVFLLHPVYGVGVGTFEQFTLRNDMDIYTENMPWLESSGLPPVNMVLELLATAGICGTLGMLFFLFPVAKWIVGRGFSSPLSKSVVCMFVMLMFESNYLRPYFWVALALCWGERQVAQRKLDLLAGKKPEASS